MNKKNLYKENSGEEDTEEELEEEEEEEEEIVDYDDFMNENISIGQLNKNEIKNEIKNEKIQEEELNQSTHNENNEDDQEGIIIKETIAEINLQDPTYNQIDLLDLDLESMPKDELINLLLKNDEPIENKKKKYKFNPKSNQNNINNQKEKVNNILSNVQQMTEIKDPELNQDFNLAMTKILSNMVKDPNNTNQEVLDILLADREKVEEELKNYEFTKNVSNKYIGEKVKSCIDKKTKNMEVIQEKVDEDFLKIHTFAPNVVNSKTSMIRRNLDQFLEDQDNHTKKIKEKMDMMREAKIRESTNEYQTAPKINQVSRKIVEEKLKNENNQNKKEVHERLYNKRIKNNSNSEIKKSPSQNSKNFNNIKKLEDRTKSLYQDAINRQVKQKEKIINQIKSENITNFKTTNHNTNKIFLKKFKTHFREEIDKLLEEVNTFNNENIKLNINHLNILMQNLNFISKDKEEDENFILAKENYSINNHKNNEKKLLLELFENIKDAEGVNLDHLFIFCLSILNLLEYFVVKSYKTDDNLNSNNNNENQIKNQKNLNKKESMINMNEDVYQNLVHKLNLELNSRILVPKKYGGFDEDNNFIISFTHAKLICRDFNLFAINYSNVIKKSKINSRQEDEPKFKPKINSKSIQMSNKYRQKMMNEIEMGNLNQRNQILNELNPNAIIKSNDRFFSPNRNTMKSPTRKVLVDNNNYLEVLKMKKIQKEKMNEKFREERENKEMERCTFKPKINNYQFKDNVTPIDNFQREQRIEILYKKGTENLINKKNKTKDDVEVERYGQECTFKPNINFDTELDNIFDDTKTNHLISDKDVQKFNERMKRGRIDKEIKDKITRRGEEIRSPTKYSEKRNKSENKIRNNIQKSDKNIISTINNNNQQNNENINTFNKKTYNNYLSNPNLTSTNTQNILNTQSSINSLSTIKTNTSNSINTLEKKNINALPLLIIDVNIKPGEKKQIIVYEGDTSEKLAASFVNQHNLDISIKSKLKILIQSQLDKLLHKIVEEEISSNKSELSNGFS